MPANQSSGRGYWKATDFAWYGWGIVWVLETEHGLVTMATIRCNPTDEEFAIDVAKVMNLAHVACPEDE